MRWVDKAPCRNTLKPGTGGASALPQAQAAAIATGGADLEVAAIGGCMLAHQLSVEDKAPSTEHHALPCAHPVCLGVLSLQASGALA
ncbi:hypothetical protein D3C77_535880 [compost metagenome]